MTKPYVTTSDQPPHQECDNFRYGWFSARLMKLKSRTASICASEGSVLSVLNYHYCSQKLTTMLTTIIFSIMMSRCIFQREPHHHQHIHHPRLLSSSSPSSQLQNNTTSKKDNSIVKSMSPR
jgi:hypothetical protein